MSTTENFKKTLVKESKKQNTSSKLFETNKKLARMGLITKTTYTLPLKDTIGRNFHKQLAFNSNSTE